MYVEYWIYRYTWLIMIYNCCAKRGRWYPHGWWASLACGWNICNSKEVSNMFWIIDPLWVQLPKQSKQGGWHSQSCARVELCFHTHIALWPLGALDANAQQSNRFGCIEGDKPSSILCSIDNLATLSFKSLADLFVSTICSTHEKEAWSWFKILNMTTPLYCSNAFIVTANT